MSQTAVLVWLSATSALPTFHADLDAFAHSRLLRLEAPLENPAPFRNAGYAPDLVAQVESSLEEARNATASIEQSRALSALERAEHLLREHPELPQCAWLMAEELELAADIENSAPDGSDTATALRKRAAVLEGPRAEPFSDRPPSTGLDAATPHAITVEGAEAGDTLEWDGVQVRSPLTTAAGEHHARVARGQRLLWAGWVEVNAQQTQVRLPVPETVPCSPDDIGQGRFVAGRAVPNPHARCGSYVLAEARVGAGIEAALCERDTCGKVVLWEHAGAAAPSKPDESRGFPRWATYTIVAAAGALTATGLVLWRAGAFDKPEARTTTAWVYSGQVKPSGFQF